MALPKNKFPDIRLHYLVDGMDVRAVHDAARKAADRARAGLGPSFLVLNTWRFSGHHAGDKQEYKDDEETRRWRALDPLPRSAEALIADGLATPKALEAMEAEVAGIVKRAVDLARAAPEPEPSRALEHIHG